MSFIYNAGRSRPVQPGGVSAKGFTLVELMVVVVIVAIFLLIAAPSYTTLTQRTRLKSYANEVVASIYLARSEAIKRNASMTLCTSTLGASCDGDGNWGQGWIVMDPNDTVIKYQKSLPSGMVLFNPGDADFDSITFQSSGLVTAGELKLCQQAPTAGIEEKLITISSTGRARVQTVTAGCP